MATTIAALILGLIKFFPETQIGLLLRKFLVDKLADKLNTLTVPRIALLGSLVFIGIALFLYSKGQSTPLLAQVSAEAAPWLFSFDLLTFVDVMAAVLLLRLAVRFTIVIYGARVIAAVVSGYSSKLVVAFHKQLASRRRARPQRKASRSGSADEDDALLAWTFATA